VRPKIGMLAKVARDAGCVAGGTSRSRRERFVVRSARPCGRASWHVTGRFTPSTHREEGQMWRQRSSRLCPDRAADERRPRPERVRGVASRHRRHRPGVEYLEDRRLLSAITEFPLPSQSNMRRA
jgi:hypothetical protein